MCWDFCILDEFDFVVSVTLFGKGVGVGFEHLFVFLKDLLDFRGIFLFLIFILNSSC